MKKYTGILKSNPLFAGLSDEEILSALRCVDARTAASHAGEYIFRAGDTTAFMGLVLSGAVLVIQEDLWGHRNIVTRVSTGDIFAESFAAVPDAVLNVSVVADEESEVMFLGIERLLDVCPTACEYHHRIVRNLLSVLAKKTLTFNEKMTHISKRTTRDKLLSFLSSEAIRQGRRSFDIPYNRQQLADYLCVERSAMSVALSKLQQEGILSYNRSHFELKELAEEW